MATTITVTVTAFLTLGRIGSTQCLGQTLICPYRQHSYKTTVETRAVLGYARCRLLMNKSIAVLQLCMQVFFLC